MLTMEFFKHSTLRSQIRGVLINRGVTSMTFFSFSANAIGDLRQNSLTGTFAALAPPRIFSLAPPQYSRAVESILGGAGTFSVLGCSYSIYYGATMLLWCLQAVPYLSRKIEAIAPQRPSSIAHTIPLVSISAVYRFGASCVHYRSVHLNCNLYDSKMGPI